ncbi:MAG: sodium:solute symporter [Bacteroidia bacterium]|nr:sodium:solute symporter [Bacteroidia bacterium]MDW8157683.1 sodium:solute symporter [Bacteroidia bacterium]
MLYYFILFFLAQRIQEQHKDTLQNFFLSNRNAPWQLVAFGMVGTLLSGVTFVSVPGDVGKEIAPGVYKGMGYLQLILGSLIGTFCIVKFLLPLYYRHQLISIYAYLGQRFGRKTYLTGAWLFLISRTLGSAIRLYLAAFLLQFLIFDNLNIPFFINAFISLALILLYTQKGGIQTIIWTDIFQTTVMLLALLGTLIFLFFSLQVPKTIFAFTQGPYSQIFFLDWRLPNHFLKQLISGIAITLVMTGLDQDMMQKNLTCRTLAQSQKNMIVSGILYTLVNILFVSLGVLLYTFAQENCISLPAATDQVYPFLATHYFGNWVSILLVLGIVAATYSSADGSLTALTTSFCVDIYQLEKKLNFLSEEGAIKFRKKVHLSFALVFAALLVIFYYFHSVQIGRTNIITIILQLAGYTYGPLLGLYSLGIFTSVNPPDRCVPWICLLVPIICYFIQKYSFVLGGYNFGFELIFVNALLVFGACLVTTWIERLYNSHLKKLTR